MTTQVLQPSSPRPAKVIHNLTWEQFEEIDRSLEDFPGVKLAYLDGLLKIMSISPGMKISKVVLFR